ncbi:hypothetical protein E0Z10_g10249 [Xylaria hypoxylon]|uniref:Uncharacterized protein n=1 Tax=Xylaria hypoxylon TaxID=37992 RepID=A0A4Z0Y6L8_9PEZI|nr:hypothetical protein E0Z10_g10249 [Xylaria hypoxylon]
MRFSVIALGLATAVQGAVIQAQDSGCTVTLEPTKSPPSAAGEIIAYGSLRRWSNATGGGGATSQWIDYSGSLKAPYSFKYKANTIPAYETNARIESVLSHGWVGTYLTGGAIPVVNDFLITGYSCN